MFRFSIRSSETQLKNNVSRHTFINLKLSYGVSSDWQPYNLLDGFHSSGNLALEVFTLVVDDTSN